MSLLRSNMVTRCGVGVRYYQRNHVLDDLINKPPVTKADKADSDSVRDASELFSSAPRKRKYKEHIVDSNLGAQERSDCDKDRYIVPWQANVIQRNQEQPRANTPCKRERP